MENIEELRILVAQSCRILGRENMTREPAGHVSARIPGTDKFVIKGRGPGEVALRYTRPEDVVVSDRDGNKLEGRGDLNTPGEVAIHAEIMKARPDVNCVIHVHPTNVVLFTITSRELLPLVGAYDPDALALVQAGIPRYPRSILISNPQLGRDLASALGDKSVCLMRGHGITACGPSVQDATVTAWRLNDLAEINYRSSLLGVPEPIPVEDQELFAEMRRAHPPAANGRATTVTWNYLIRRLQEEMRG
jgi:ribulose-5-phosphate 4-epimerase/fuculose-1-phosphate aldolase